MKNLFTFTLQHWYATVLRSDEEWCSAFAKCLSCKLIGPLHMMLVHAGYKEMSRDTDRHLAIPEIILRLAVPYREYIIIEIHELITQPRDSVHEQTDCSAVESRKILLWDEILMQNYIYSLTVNP